MKAIRKTAFAAILLGCLAPAGAEADSPGIAAAPRCDGAATEKPTRLPGIGLEIVLPGIEAERSPCSAALREMPRPKAPDIFGSTALAVGATPLDARWRDIRQQGIAPEGPWRAMLLHAAGQDRAGQIRLVNNWVNARIAFAEDAVTHGMADHWSPPGESIARGRGDCEDYAIAKMALLESLGVPSRDMYLVIVREVPRQADHAVLAVRDEDALLVLDNKTDRILRSELISDYRPVMSYSAQYAWAHGYRSMGAATASRAP